MLAYAGGTDRANSSSVGIDYGLQSDLLGFQRHCSA